MTTSTRGELRYVEGNVTFPVRLRPFIVAHVCNDAGRWGAGVSGVIGRQWPYAEACYRGSPSSQRLGVVQMVVVADDTFVANMVAQRAPSRTGPPPIDYDALGECLCSLGDFVMRYVGGAMTVHMPRIGCGLARGSWDRVEPLIQEHLVARGVEVFIYDLPGSKLIAK